MIQFTARKGLKPLTSEKRIIFFFLFIFAAAGFTAAAPLGTNYPKVPRATPAEARALVVEAAKKYIGTPYVYAGLSSRGLDCSGFIRVSYNDALGIPMTSMPASAAGQHSWAERVPIANAQPGDLVFFRTGTTSAVTHVGLYVGNRQFLHAASAGARTGIIYSNLDENYYAERFVSAGRALPAASGSVSSGSGRQRDPAGTGRNSGSSSSGGQKNKTGSSFPFYISVAAAPTWNIFYINEEVIRGFSSHIGVGAEFAPKFDLGIELRPEYDNVLGVFRLPVTLSWGPSEKLRFFAGPVLSIESDASFDYDGTIQNYSGGTNWFGAAGITFLPVIIEAKRSDFAPYLEGAWQGYSSDNATSEFVPDLTAWFRFSTGIRWRLFI